MVLFTSTYCKLHYQNPVLILSWSLSTQLPLGAICPDFPSQDSLEWRNDFLTFPPKKFSLCWGYFFFKCSVNTPECGYHKLSMIYRYRYAHIHTYICTHIQIHCINYIGNISKTISSPVCTALTLSSVYPSLSSVFAHFFFFFFL